MDQAKTNIALESKPDISKKFTAVQASNEMSVQYAPKEQSKLVASDYPQVHKNYFGAIKNENVTDSEDESNKTEFTTVKPNFSYSKVVANSKISANFISTEKNNGKSNLESRTQTNTILGSGRGKLNSNAINRSQKDGKPESKNFSSAIYNGKKQ